ncbi:hypothetical protein [Aurantivibrio plasticivorans]
MEHSKQKFRQIQIIQWQLTTRLLGSKDGQHELWQQQDARPSLIKRDSGFRGFVDSDGVYEAVMTLAKQHPELLRCDAVTRITTLYDVLSAAVIHADRNSDVLKVFMAPDGYFCDSETGAYTLSQTRLIKHMLQAIIGCQERFENWLIIPGTIKWLKDDTPFSGLEKSLIPLAPLNSSAVVLYSGSLPLVHVDGRESNSACFFIEPVNDHPGLIVPKSPWGGLDVYEPAEERRLQDLHRHIFAIGGLRIGVEINQEQASANNGNNVLTRALKSIGKAKESLGLQLLLSSGQLLNPEHLNLEQGGLAASVNGIVGLAGEPEPIEYQMIRRERDGESSRFSQQFLRRNFVLPVPLQNTGKPESSCCYNMLGREESLLFNYTLGTLRVFKPVISPTLFERADEVDVLEAR